MPKKEDHKPIGQVEAIGRLGLGMLGGLLAVVVIGSIGTEVGIIRPENLAISLSFLLSICELTGIYLSLR